MLEEKGAVLRIVCLSSEMNSLQLLALRNKISINGAKCGGALWSHCKDECCGVLQSTP